eukprot:XP_014071694.1 PREDICTED: 39S ribosomal protein L54, mitochondrial-like isoform X1 [Salmo salar]
MVCSPSESASPAATVLFWVGLWDKIACPGWSSEQWIRFGKDLLLVVMMMSNAAATSVSSTTSSFSRYERRHPSVIQEKGKCIVKDVLKGPELCKDPVKLTSHAVGVNILKQGDDPALKPHKEYPEWLFQLQLGPLKNIHKLEPDSREYWKVLRKEHVVL